VAPLAALVATALAAVAADVDASAVGVVVGVVVGAAAAPLGVVEADATAGVDDDDDDVEDEAGVGDEKTVVNRDDDEVLRDDEVLERAVDADASAVERAPIVLVDVATEPEVDRVKDDGIGIGAVADARGAWKDPPIPLRLDGCQSRFDVVPERDME
jgi:hypothetical protein